MGERIVLNRLQVYQQEFINFCWALLVFCACWVLSDTERDDRVTILWHLSNCLNYDAAGLDVAFEDLNEIASRWGYAYGD